MNYSQDSDDTHRVFNCVLPNFKHVQVRERRMCVVEDSDKACAAFNIQLKFGIFADVEVREGEFCLVKGGEVLQVEPKAFRHKDYESSDRQPSPLTSG